MAIFYRTLSFAVGILSIQALGATVRGADIPESTETEKSFHMDIPSEWMQLSKDLRSRVTVMDSDHIDFKWGVTSSLQTSVPTFSGAIPVASDIGTLSLGYTSIRINSPVNPYLAIRLRGEIDYTSLIARSPALQVHDVRIKTGMNFELNQTRWNTGNISLALCALWAQWFAPQTRDSLGQSKNRVGMQGSIDVIQQLGKSNFHAVATLARQEYFLASPSQHGVWVAQMGLGLAL